MKIVQRTSCCRVKRNVSEVSVGVTSEQLLLNHVDIWMMLMVYFLFSSFRRIFLNHTFIDQLVNKY